MSHIAFIFKISFLSESRENWHLQQCESENRRVHFQTAHTLLLRARLKHSSGGKTKRGSLDQIRPRPPSIQLCNVMYYGQETFGHIAWHHGERTDTLPSPSCTHTHAHTQTVTFHPWSSCCFQSKEEQTEQSRLKRVRNTFCLHWMSTNPTVGSRATFSSSLLILHGNWIENVIRLNYVSRAP